MVVQVGDSLKKQVSLFLNDTSRIAVSAADLFQRPVGVRPTFISRNPFVASVSSTGLIKGLATGVSYVVGLVNGVNGKIVSDSIRVDVTVICTAEARPGVVITMQDSTTGSKGPFTVAQYIAKQGAAQIDSVQINSVPAQIGGSDFAVGMLYENPGTFAITVRAAGYKDWLKPGVVVAKDNCHVITVNLVARLIPK